VLVVGGNAVGLETALYLAFQGTLSPEILHFLMINRAESIETLAGLLNRGDKDVTVVEMTNKAGEDISASTRWTIKAELKRLGVTIMTGTRAMGVTPEGLEVEREDGSALLPADSIVVAAGSRPDNLLADELEGVVPEIHVIGDAKQARNALEAIKEGLLIGLEI
ncbi:MAG: FAD-dependent oxidoreductase, partial [Desulfobacterales bacterium]|nr:FAD-dependent oxidoreductase [Desulfobacterales bacterium]